MDNTLKNNSLRVLLLDNYDSFTYNLYDYLMQVGTECTVIRNDALILEDVEAQDFQAIVLSPGPKRPENAGVMPALIDTYWTRLPMLGVCLGHQGLAAHAGAAVMRARVPVHGKTSRIHHTGHALFAGIPSPFLAMRYHSLLVQSLDQTPFETLATTEENEIMAFAHISLPLYGVQFHPESILTEYGLLLLHNWVQLACASVSKNVD